MPDYTSWMSLDLCQILCVALAVRVMATAATTTLSFVLSAIVTARALSSTAGAHESECVEIRMEFSLIS